MFQPKQKLREYQKEALDYALSRENAVCVLPTGTGKTLVGLNWCCSLLNNKRAKRILVLEPTRFLVEQVYNYYLTKANFTKENLAKIYGIIDQKERIKEWKKESVISICTPQVAFNDLFYLYFDAVVIDECHHTTGRHSFSELMRKYPGFKYKLGLSATVPKYKEREIEQLVGKIKRWPWKELKDRYPQFIPDWVGEIYDAELEEKEIKLLEMLEDRRILYQGLPSALVSLAIRMFTRDGALALNETLSKGTSMAKIIGDEIRSYVETLESLHKLKEAEAVLSDHDFEKAILFVDRVCIAKKLFEFFKPYNPVLILGRLRSSQEEQRKAVEATRDPNVKLIISTSAGEEGMDLPDADLLIVWSNVASCVRFIQRHGRIMRPSEKLKVSVFIATPGTKKINSPDYDSLYEGIAAAAEEGLDIEGVDEIVKQIKSKSYKERVRNLVENEPLKYTEIQANLKQPEQKLKRWLSSCVNDKDGDYRLFYIYEFPEEKFKKEILKVLKDRYERRKEDKTIYYYRDMDKISRSTSDEVCRLKVEDRLYITALSAEMIEKEFPQLFLNPAQINTPLKLRIYNREGRKNKKLLCMWIISGHVTLWGGIREKFNIDESGSWILRIWEILGQYRAYPLDLKFSERGKSRFIAPFDYYGIFTEKTFDLAIRNALYIGQSFRKLVEFTDVEFSKIINKNEKDSFSTD